MKKYMCLLILTAIQIMTRAASVPEGAIFREAEDFKNVGKGWSISDNWNGCSGMPSGAKLMRGNNSEMGTLGDVFKIGKSVKYRIHFRYIDLSQHREKIAFKLTVQQNGRIVAEKVFDDNPESVRKTPEGKKKWGEGWAAFVWGEITCELVAGDMELAFSKMHKSECTGLARNIDCVVISPDLSYEPQINDFQKPLYLKVRMDKGQTVPAAIHMFAWGSRGLHYNLTSAGFFTGVYTGLDKKQYMKEGDESPWFNIRDTLDLGKSANYNFEAIQEYGKGLPESYFTLLISRTPSEEGLIKKISRTGQGSGIGAHLYNSLEMKIETDVEESEENLKRVSGLGTAPGKRPRKFTVATGLGLGQISCDSVRKNELESLSRIGLNSLGFCGMDLIRQGMDEYGFTGYEGNCFVFAHTKPKDCYGSPDATAMEKAIENYANKLKEYRLDDKIKFISWMDEPGYSLDHVVKCETCKKNFTVFLKEQKLEPKDLGINSLEEAVPSDDPAKGALFYWSVKFYTSNMTRMYSVPSAILKKYLPDVKTGANFGDEIVDNMVSHGNDWFDIYDTGALSYGWTEEWINLQSTYQLCGFKTAALRMVCTRNGREYGIYDIIQGRSQWAIEAKAFTEIGNGIRSLNFFNYGPHYAVGDNSSRRPEAMQAMKNVSFAIGEREEALLSSAPARADAAMLFSNTSDIWNYKDSKAGGNLYGKERGTLFILLRHCNVRLDLLGEDMLRESLKNYKMLFAVDSHIKSEALDVIVNWVKDGGTLYLGPGSLLGDKYNRPTGVAQMLSLPRGELVAEKLKGNYLESVLNALKPVGELKIGADKLILVAGLQLLNGGKVLINGNDGKKLMTVTSLGKGKIINCGFFFGMSYFKGAKRDPVTQFLSYPEPSLNLMRQVMEEAGVKPLIETNDPMVEAHLLEGKQSDVIVLSNWSGTAKTVKVSVNGKIYRKVSGVRSKPEMLSPLANGCEFVSLLGSGDIIECEK